ncbi:MAG: nitroreductase family protein [Muribaculaceae bacterium]|nr:nitroreductase family protein [Muribaculaceae bacterium]
MLKSLLKADRSYRRFDETYIVARETLIQMIELTRYCASGRNIQPMKYFIVNDKETCNLIFPLLKWAGYLLDWDGPVKGERPTSYIIQYLDTSITKNYLCDDGLHLQTITLGAVAQGLGCCIIKSFDINKLKEILNLKDNLEPLYIIAVGKPIEKVIIEDLDSKEIDKIKYYRSADGTHHVPKRKLEELIIS